MKKITAVLAAAIAASMSLTAYAASARLDAENPSGDGDVHAIYTENAPWNEVPVDENGSGSAQLPDGTDVSVDGADSSRRLIIDPITEQEALDWISGVLGEKYENLLAYNIYYLEDGAAYPADGVRVTISADRDFTFSLKTDGTSNGLVTDLGGADMTFTTDGGPFYVLCTEAADDSSDDSDNSDASSSSSDVSSDASSDTSSGDASLSNGSSAASSSSSSKSSSGAASSTSPKPNSTVPNDGGSPKTGLGAGITLASLLVGGALAVTAAKGSHEKRDKK